MIRQWFIRIAVFCWTTALFGNVMWTGYVLRQLGEVTRIDNWLEREPSPHRAQIASRRRAQPAADRVVRPLSGR